MTHQRRNLDYNWNDLLIVASREDRYRDRCTSSSPPQQANFTDANEVMYASLVFVVALDMAIAPDMVTIFIHFAFN